MGGFLRDILLPALHAPFYAAPKYPPMAWRNYPFEHAPSWSQLFEHLTLITPGSDDSKRAVRTSFPVQVNHLVNHLSFSTWALLFVLPIWSGSFFFVCGTSAYIRSLVP